LGAASTVTDLPLTVRWVCMGNGLLGRKIWFLGVYATQVTLTAKRIKDTKVDNFFSRYLVRKYPLAHLEIAFYQLNFVTVWVLHKGDHGRATGDGACFAGNFPACLANFFASSLRIGHA